MAITVFELLKQYIDKKKLGYAGQNCCGSTFYNKTKGSGINLCYIPHMATYFYIYEARKASVTPCPNLVTKSQKYAKVLLEFSDKILTRKHEKDLASEIVEIR